MFVLHIEHQVHDPGAWKAAFDRDPVGRREGGVLSYRIERPVKDPLRVMIALTFARLAEAEAFQAALESLWRSPAGAAMVADLPRTHIAEVVEDTTT
jgi:hypothetical protein